MDNQILPNDSAGKQEMRKRLQKQRNRQKRSKGLIVILCVLLLIIVLLAGLALKKAHDSKSSNVDFTDTQINPDRETLAHDYLAEDDSLEKIDDCFAVTVSKSTRGKTLIEIKNTSDRYFTGKIVIHEASSLELVSFAPNCTKSYETAVELTNADNDYTFDGKFYALDKTNLLSFSVQEERIDRETTKCFLSVSDFSEEEQKELAYYYYVLDSLYNYPAAKEYHLYDEDGSTSLGVLVVDITKKTVTYSKNNTTIFTETY